MQSEKLISSSLDTDTREPSNAAELRRDELCLQLAENLHDLGASDFLRELQAGGDRFVIRVQRC